MPGRRMVFQSTPGELAGRYPRQAGRWPGADCFNPRPANWPGDMLGDGGAGGDLLCFNPRPANWPGDIQDPATGQIVNDVFQSTPGELAGRYAMRLMSITQHACFNPRPANWPGDIGRSMASLPSHRRFNPRPANWPGDIGVAVLARSADDLFQSTPGELAGRYAMNAGPRSAKATVSIHARRIGRAISTIPRGPITP